MRLFGWLNVFKSKPTPEEVNLARELHQVASVSSRTQERIDKIVNIEQVRLRNLELRAEVLGRVRIRQ